MFVLSTLVCVNLININTCNIADILFLSETLNWYSMAKNSYTKHFGIFLQVANKKLRISVYICNS